MSIPNVSSIDSRTLDYPVILPRLNLCIARIIWMLQLLVYEIFQEMHCSLYFMKNLSKICLSEFVLYQKFMIIGFYWIVGLDFL